MNEAKYIGMDVYQTTISAAVRDSSGNLVMETTNETKKPKRSSRLFMVCAVVCA
jgi:predicted NBD/HSP70 family sugar kinase